MPAARARRRARRSHAPVARQTAGVAGDRSDDSVSVSSRELVVLGTASQVPTRTRNHNGFVLRLDGELVLFDPGEGTQRQMTLAGVSAARLSFICITHFHGDHCLGLPGVLQRRWLDAPVRPIGLAYPATGEDVLDHLRRASLVDRSDEHLLIRHPVHGEGPVTEVGSFRLTAAPLDHTVPAVGYRLDEADRSHVLPDRLAALGVAGPLVGRLQREGVVVAGGRRVTLDEVSEVRPGLRIAFIMDTRPCEAAERLAEGVDVLVCEATFVSADADLADAYGHMTAAQAARLAATSGARLLVLGHFSSRYPDPRVLAEDAATAFGDVIVAHDLQHIALPRPQRGATLR